MADAAQHHLHAEWIILSPILVSFLDLPSRLSLSLASRCQFTAYYDSGLFRNNRFRVLDEAARRGYLALLKDLADDGGVDGAVLLAAVEGGSLDVIRWVVEQGVLPSRYLCERICEASFRGEDIEVLQYLLKTSQRLFTEPHLDVQERLVYHGKLDWRKNLFPDSSTPSLYHLARGGHLEAILKLNEQPDLPSIANAALTGTASKEIIRFALDCGIPISSFMFSSNTNSLECEVLQMMYEASPDSVASHLDSILDVTGIVIRKPRLDVVRFLLTKYESQFPQNFLEMLMLTKVHNPQFVYESDVSDQLKTMDHQERFACVKFYLEMKLPSLPLPLDYLRNVPCWASIDEFKHLFYKVDAKAGKDGFEPALLFYLRRFSRVDVDYVKFLVYKGARVNVPVILEVALNENAIEVLEILKKISTKALLEAFNAPRDIFESLVDTYRLVLEAATTGAQVYTDECVLCEKMRVNKARFISVITWTLKNGLSPKRGFDLAKLDVLRHPKFLAEWGRMKELAHNLLNQKI